MCWDLRLCHLTVWVPIWALLLFSLWPWAGHLTSLCFSFLICNSEIIIISLSKDCLRIKYVNVLMLITCLKQLLGYNLCSINAFLLQLLLCVETSNGEKMSREVKEKLLPPFLSFPLSGKSSLIGFLATLSLNSSISYLLFLQDGWELAF